MTRETGQIDAVHSQDLQRLLQRMGIAEQFNKGEFKCKFCDTIVTAENIYSILPESGSFNLICDNPECVIKMSEYLNEKGKAKSAT